MRKWRMEEWMRNYRGSISDERKMMAISSKGDEADDCIVGKEKREERR